MKRLFIVPACIILFFGIQSIVSGAPLHFEYYGFTINELEGESDGDYQQVLIMSLPTTSSFAPNVNVQIQPYEGSLEEYVALSREQIAKLGWSIIHVEISDEGFATLEYSGETQGRSLHWYAKTVLGNGSAYLVTATATETEWSEVSKKLITTVDSFRLD